MATTDTDILADLCPTDPLMAWPWYSFVSASLRMPEIVAQFREATGQCWEPGRTPLDRMIDTAAGADVAFIQAFAQWLNAVYWGEEHGRASNGGL